MFNYFTYEKILKEQEEEAIKKEKEEKHLELKRKKNKKLIESYDKRIKDFIFNMINKPVKINDFHSPVESTRQELMKELSNPNEFKFKFKGFVTEKDRIKAFIEEKVKNDEVFKSYDKNLGLDRSTALENTNTYYADKKIYDSNNKNFNKKLYDILQPKVLFKPRSNLERVLEAVQKQNTEKKENDLINQQLRDLEGNLIKRISNTDSNHREETIENIEDYLQFINSNNKIAIMRAIQDKNLDNLVKKNELMNKKKLSYMKNSDLKPKNLKMNKDHKTLSKAINNYNSEDEDDVNKIYYNNFIRNDSSGKKGRDSINRRVSFSLPKNDNFTRILNRNTAKKIKKDSHAKTHFKAVSIIANNSKQSDLNFKIKSTHSVDNEHDHSNINSNNNYNNFCFNNIFRRANKRQENHNSYNIKEKMNGEIKELNFNKSYSTNFWGDKKQRLDEKISMNAYMNNQDYYNSQNQEINRNIYSSQASNKILSKFNNKNFTSSKNSRNILLSPNKSNNLNRNYSKTIGNYRDNSTSSNLIAKLTSKLSLNEANLDMIEANPLLYNLNFNSIMKKNNNSNNNNKYMTGKATSKGLNSSQEQEEQSQKLEYLKQLAFVYRSNKDANFYKRTNKFNQKIKFLSIKENTNKETESELNEDLAELTEELSFKKGSLTKKNNTSTMNLVEDEKILVDNIPYSKNNIDKIAKQILKNCNFTHTKNKNNDTNLKVGNGKLMITSGLTVSEFNKRFNIYS